MGDFVARYSRSRVALLLLSAIVFVILGLWMGGVFGTPSASPRYSPAMIFGVGWFSVFFFGACGVVAAKRLFDSGVQLQIGPAGVRYPQWSDDVIPWSEIRGVSTWTVSRQKGIVLQLHDPTRFPRRKSTGFFAKLNRLTTGGDVSISLTGMDQSFDEAMSAIARFRP